MKRLTISLPDDLAAALQQESERRNVPGSSIVREAVRREVGYWTSDDFAGIIGIADSGGIGPFAEDLDALLESSWVTHVEDDRDPRSTSDRDTVDDTAGQRTP
jgi:hypothetical protein